MPGHMNRHELGKEVVRRFPMTRVLLTSGYAEIESGMSFNTRDVQLLRKPYRREDLLVAYARRSTRRAGRELVLFLKNVLGSLPKLRNERTAHPKKFWGFMFKKVIGWLGREFIELSVEGDGLGTATQETQRIFGRMAEQLGQFGLTLDHVVRTRLWGRDRASRDAGSEVRFATLAGGARAASSSYIAPERFENPAARVALDLLALKTSPAPVKSIRENDPPRTPIRYLTIDSLVVLSGMTCQRPGLDEQLADILPRIGSALTEAGTGWNKVARMSCYLHRSQSPDALKAGIGRWTTAAPAELEIAFVDGFSAAHKLIEIETTALR